MFSLKITVILRVTNEAMRAIVAYLLLKFLLQGMRKMFIDLSVLEI